MQGDESITIEQQVISMSAEDDKIYTFDKTKSHLSDEKKQQFEENATAGSPVIEIPGVGAITKKNWEKQNILTIQDLLNTIKKDTGKPPFHILRSITPHVNCHKIYDSLEVFLNDVEDEYLTEVAIKKRIAIEDSKDLVYNKIKDNDCIIQ